jgi:NAD(P)-dependent dehydrogenase (short-subunit alcohol dehydrogenase family)
MAERVVIYGGSGGIGSVTARVLRQRGFSLHLVARGRERLEVLAEALDASYSVEDVTDDESFERVADAVPGPWSGLVYAVGGIRLRPLKRLSEAELLDDVRQHAVLAALAVQAALPALTSHEGTASVVLFSSVAALQGFRLHASMGLAKGAVVGLTRCLAAELAPKVRVNAIAPSITHTPGSRRLLVNEQMNASIASLHALQRLGAPDDIAAAAAFLISSEADWITGQVLSVDGGRSTLRTKG